MARHNARTYKAKTEGVDHSKFFDYKSSRNIEKLMEIDAYKAIELYEQYLEHYPEDYSSHERYLSLLIKVGYYDKAFEVLKYLEVMVYDGKLKNVKDGRNKYVLMKNIVFAKLRLLVHTGKYNEAYTYINQNVDLVNMHNLENIPAIIFYLKTRLGTTNQTREEQKCYLFSQLAEYNEEAFIEHAKRHIEGYTDEEGITAYFKADFPLEKVFEEVKKHYSLDKRISRGITNDEYYFKYDGCGHQNGVSCDYFIVVTFANNPHYVTMFPEPDAYKYPYVDLNYMKEDQKSKVRKLSQIEKFNQRYGK